MSKRFIVECDLIDYRRSLLDSLEQGCYIFLTHAIVPKVTEYISSYNEVLILCRRRVKDLFLGDSVCSYDFFDGLPREFNKLANRLPEFTSLTSITIRNNMDKIIDNYPLLTELELTLVSRTLEEWVSHGYGNDADNYNNAIDLSKITPRPKIDTFLGTLVFHSDKSLKYFIHKFPKLKKLKLNDSDVYDLSTTLVETKLSVEIMIQFFKYLFTTPNCTVDHIYIENALQFIALLHRLSKDDYKIEEFQIKYTTELFGNVADIWRNKDDFPLILIF